MILEVDAVFERFPASVRGALALRGRDPEPHQVDVLDAGVVELASPSRNARDLGLEGIRVDVPPRGEMLVPFEIPFATLGPGWYEIRAEVEVDGLARVRGPADGPRFFVPWPRGATRRGAVAEGLRIHVPRSEGATVERIEGRIDSAIIRWRHAPAGEGAAPEFGELKVLADGHRLPVLEVGFEPGSGERTTVTYPLLKDHRSLTLELDRRHRPGGAAQRGSWSVEVPL